MSEQQQEQHKMTLRDTIIPKSDQLNFDDLLTGPRTFRVVGLKSGSEDQPVIVCIVDAFTGEKERDYKPCKSMRRVLISAWGDKGKDWIGKQMVLFGEPTIKWGGVEVGGIRISHVSGISEPMSIKLTTARSKRSDYVVRPIADTKQEA